MKVLGAQLRHFGYNRGWAIVFTLGTLMFATFATASITVLRKDIEWWEALIFFAGAALCLYAFARTASSSATICETGIRYQVFRNQGEMLWDDIEKFRYSVVVTYHQGIIKTTTYTIVLADKDGHRVELGSNVERPKELAALLLEKLQPRLYAKLLTAYEAGQDVDLGAIKISRERIQLETGLGTKTIPLPNVAGCSFDNGSIRIAEQVDGKVKQRAVMMRRVDNAFALADLINHRIIQKPLAAAVGK